MQFCFIQGDTVLTMPVTPDGYEFAVGRRKETINISAMGDVFRAGGRSRWSKTIPFLLPAQEYTFMEPGARAQPQYYLDRLQEWCVNKTPVRLIITETEINLTVEIETVNVREQDGSGDRYVDVTVWEAVEPTTSVDDPLAMKNGIHRTIDSGPEQVQSYTIRKGDSLGMICRRFYGNSGAKYYNALASYNGIKNPHLIYAGRTIQVPPEAALFGGAK